MRRLRVAIGIGVLFLIGLFAWIAARPERSVPGASSSPGPESTDVEPPPALEADGTTLRAAPASGRPTKTGTGTPSDTKPNRRPIVRGRVLDNDGVTPPHSGRVVVVPRQGAPFTIELRAGGSFEGEVALGNESSGSVDVTVHAFVEGWAIPEQSARADGEPIKLVRSGTARVAIQVVFADGRVAANERLAFASFPPPSDGLVGYAEDGSLDVRTLAQFTSGAIIARTDERGRCTVDSNDVLYPIAGRKELAPGATEATVTLHRAYGVDLHFVDADSGVALSNVAVWLTEDRLGRAGSSWGFGGLTAGQCGYRRPVLDASALPVRVHVAADGRAHVGTALDIDLTDVAPFVVRTFRLAPFGPTNSGALVLSTPWTTDRPGHVFNLARTKTVGRSTLTDDLPLERAGRDRWTTRLAPGTHALSVVPAYEHARELVWKATVEIRVGETTTIEPTLPPNGTLRIAVSPTPVEGDSFALYVSLRHADGRPFWSHATAISSEGRTLPFMPVGDFVLRVGSGEKGSPHAFTIEADRATEVVVSKSELLH